MQRYKIAGRKRTTAENIVKIAKYLRMQVAEIFPEKNYQMLTKWFCLLKISTIAL